MAQSTSIFLHRMENKCIYVHRNFITKEILMHRAVFKTKEVWFVSDHGSELWWRLFRLLHNILPTESKRVKYVII